MKQKIVWTQIDEAPALASYSLLPIVKSFTKGCDIEIETKDISLSGRILANFPDFLKDDQKINDYLEELGQLTQSKEANIVKLPNISASIPQLKSAIQELQDKGFNIPNYPDNAQTDEELKIKERYSKVLGSAVNPVLREGNSDRRAAASVKAYGQKNPHKMMKPWDDNSKTHVAHMNNGDFFGNEKTVEMAQDDQLSIELKTKTGENIVLKKDIAVEAKELVDATFISKKALYQFYQKEMAEAKKEGILFSLHLKATMMKVSDPILFGIAVEAYFEEFINKHKATLEQLKVNFNNGLNDLVQKIKTLPEAERTAIEKDLEEAFANNADLAMVDSDKGITNLHMPNDVIIDASMPVVVRDGGKMWNAKGKLQQTKAVVPDRSYATMYKEIMEDCKRNGAFDPSTMGTVSNVGLMAKKAEEYGSHPTTFQIPADGTANVIDKNGNILASHEVEAGDIWRMAKTKDIAVKDWVKLAVNRSRISETPAIFWLDENRAHDAAIIKKVKQYLPEHDTTGLEIKILSPVDAMKFSTERVRKGLNTISVTGNVLRDYLTDLFPILELGTSAKMLSIVPLLKGGGLFETGAGGSAPKHVQQFLKEGHLRWDSLGEFCALTASFDHIYQTFDNPKAKILSETLDTAVGMFLENEKSPSRKVNEIDNRGSHFYLALYWAKALAEQNDNAEMKQRFEAIYKELSDNEATISKELLDQQGQAIDVNGYYKPDTNLLEKAMRPSAMLNKIIDTM